MKDMSKKDDLIEMCDKLEKKKNSCNYEGEVREAKIMVESYVKKDRNKLIKLRAELEYHRNFNESTQNSLTFFGSVPFTDDISIWGVGLCQSMGKIVICIGHVYRISCCITCLPYNL